MNQEEQNYLNLLQKVLDEGIDENKERTGVGTIKLIGEKLVFDLSKGFPLLTTKKVNFDSVLKELLFFISGETNTKILSEQGVKIWEGNTSREALDKLGLKDYKEGELGKGYSYLWKYYGGNYPEKKGFDQLNYIINEIKTNPGSRRIILNSWDPTALNKVALPPCHVLVQFFIENDTIHSQVYLRSNDLFLGAPFNISSYAILTQLIGHICKISKLGKMHYIIGDCHLYSNHIDQVKLQLKRIPKQFPKLIIKNYKDKIDDYKVEDFVVENYESENYIKASMAI